MANKSYAVTMPAKTVNIEAPSEGEAYAVLARFFGLLADEVESDDPRYAELGFEAAAAPIKEVE